jgi:hypothetical protein
MSSVRWFATVFGLQVVALDHELVDLFDADLG